MFKSRIIYPTLTGRKSSPLDFRVYKEDRWWMNIDHWLEEVYMPGKLKMITAMLIFGSIGLFVKNIHLSSREIALFRGIIGSIFLLVASSVLRKKIRFHTSKKNIALLILSGGAIGFNWIFLFEAYRYTTISNATLSYYFAPIFVMILAPLILKEKLTWMKVTSIVSAMVGLFLIVGTDTDAGEGYDHVTGIMYGLLAAAFYASVIVMNKFIKNLPDYETTVAQLSLASLVLLPYVFLNETVNIGSLDGKSVLFMIIVGIIHTGLAYVLYFSALKELNGHTIAIFSYIDPISAVIMAAIFLGEGMSFVQMIGGILILSSTYLSERNTISFPANGKK